MAQAGKHANLVSVSDRLSASTLNLNPETLRPKSFETAQEFLSSQCSDSPGCLILDVRLPGISGLDLQHELKRGKVGIPIIFRFCTTICKSAHSTRLSGKR